LVIKKFYPGRVQQENKIRPRQIAEIAVAMEIAPFAFVKKGVLRAKGSLQRSQCQISFFLREKMDSLDLKEIWASKVTG